MSRIAHNGSFYYKLVASGKPGAVQSADIARRIRYTAEFRLGTVEQLSGLACVKRKFMYFEEKNLN